MEPTTKRFLWVSAMLLVSGCAAPSQQTPQAVSKPPKSTVEYQRFVPIGPDTTKQGVPWFVFFALDTKTGLLCRTADWQLKDSWGTLPTCYDLFAESEALRRQEARTSN